MSARARKAALVTGASLVLCGAAYGVGRSVKETTRVTPAETPSEIVIESEGVVVPPQGPSLPDLPRDPTATPARTPPPSTDLQTTDQPSTDAPTATATATATTRPPTRTDVIVDLPPQTDIRPPSTDVTDNPPTDIVGPN